MLVRRDLLRKYRKLRCGDLVWIDAKTMEFPREYRFVTSNVQPTLGTGCHERNQCEFWLRFGLLLLDVHGSQRLVDEEAVGSDVGASDIMNANIFGADQLRLMANS